MITHHTFGGAQPFTVGILLSQNAWDANEIETHYIEPLEKLGIPRQSIVATSLEKDINNKASIKVIRKHLDAVLRMAVYMQIKLLIVADADYFKPMANVRKVAPYAGYIVPCKIHGYEHLSLVTCPSYKALFHNPIEESQKITRALTTVHDHFAKVYIAPGSNILHSETYPDNYATREAAFKHLYNYDAITCDIETTSLEFSKAKILTIAFAWNEHEGFAIRVGSLFGPRALLISFFESYPGKIIYHGGTFDIKVLIYLLFMNGIRDMDGMLHGLDIMCKNIGDTMLLTYLATNSTAGNKLKLKDQSQEFSGNYALSDIADAKFIPTSELLRYNLIDAVSTWYVYNKHYQEVVNSNQLDLYQNLFIPGMKVIIQMELCGMPMEDTTMKCSHKLVQRELTSVDNALHSVPAIKEFTKLLRNEKVITDNLLLKKKKRTYDDLLHILFNPNSNKQVGKLLHDFFDLPITDLTDKGAPSVGAETLQKHLVYLTREFSITDEELGE